jgi:hypothetical protein
LFALIVTLLCDLARLKLPSSGRYVKSFVYSVFKVRNLGLGVGLDGPYCVRLHRTNINLQLSKGSGQLPFAAHPPTSKVGFGRTNRTKANARELPSTVIIETGWACEDFEAAKVVR